jgi:hypothetical protein
MDKASGDPGGIPASVNRTPVPRPSQAARPGRIPSSGGSKRRAIGSPPTSESTGGGEQGDTGGLQVGPQRGWAPGRWSGPRPQLRCPIGQCGFLAQRQSGMSRHLCTVHSGLVLSAEEASALTQMGHCYCRTDHCGNLRHGRQCPWCHTTDTARPVVRGDRIRAIPAYRPGGEARPIPHQQTGGEEGRRQLGQALKWAGTVAADDGEELTEEGGACLESTLPSDNTQSATGLVVSNPLGGESGGGYPTQPAGGGVVPLGGSVLDNNSEPPNTVTGASLQDPGGPVW